MNAQKRSSETQLYMQMTTEDRQTKRDPQKHSSWSKGKAEQLALFKCSLTNSWFLETRKQSSPRMISEKLPVQTSPISKRQPNPFLPISQVHCSMCPLQRVKPQTTGKTPAQVVGCGVALGLPYCEEYQLFHQNHQALFIPAFLIYNPLNTLCTLWVVSHRIYNHNRFRHVYSPISIEYQYFNSHVIVNADWLVAFWNTQSEYNTTVC